jgi:predicted nuclease of predicted toxin-antitoxin system
MVRMLTDFDFNGRIVRGVVRQRPGFDVIRVQDIGLAEDTPDPEILEWAARNDRIVLTHDRNTMVGFAYNRVAAGDPMPGVLIVDNSAPIGQIIDDLLLIDDITPHAEWADRVEYLPL